VTAPLILTLALDEHSFAFFDEKRRRHFPPQRNHIPAHLTLFHALPGQELATIARDLSDVCSTQQPFSLAVIGLRPLGNGVAYRLDSPDLADLRHALVRRWASWLGPQDRQRHDPHVTIQNKVHPSVARTTLAEFERAFTPFAATGEGLDLWWYRGGPWEKAGAFPFRSGSCGATGVPSAILPSR
jgi:hypothetical protein